MSAMRALIAGLAMAAICAIAVSRTPYLTFIPAIVLYLAIAGDRRVIRQRLRR